LTKIQANRCKLKSLPSSFGKLSNLQRVEIANNELGETFPESMNDLRKIIALDLNSNRLRVIPDFIAKWSEGQHTINLAKNQISAIPDWVGESNIVSLDLSENLIVEIPESIGKSKIKSRGLSISDNPIREIHNFPHVRIKLDKIPKGNWNKEE
jgi:leucine-rich repeat protein SHOC2